MQRIDQPVLRERYANHRPSSSNLGSFVLAIAGTARFSESPEVESAVGTPCDGWDRIPPGRSPFFGEQSFRRVVITHAR